MMTPLVPKHEKKLGREEDKIKSKKASKNTVPTVSKGARVYETLVKRVPMERCHRRAIVQTKQNKKEKNSSKKSEIREKYLYTISFRKVQNDVVLPHPTKKNKKTSSGRKPKNQPKKSEMRK